MCSPRLGAGPWGAIGVSEHLTSGPSCRALPTAGSVTSIQFSVVRDLRMAEGVLRGHEGLGRHVVLVDEEVHPFVGGLRLHSLVQLLVELLQVGAGRDLGDVGVALLAQQVAEVEGQEEVDEEVRHGVGALDPFAVFGPAHEVLRGGRTSRGPRELVRLPVHLPLQPHPVVGEDSLRQGSSRPSARGRCGRGRAGPPCCR